MGRIGLGIAVDGGLSAWIPFAVMPLGMSENVSSGIPQGAPRISDAAWRSAASQGILILRSPTELLAYVREFG